MANFNPFSAFWLSLFLLITLFYLYRVSAFLIRAHRFDMESEIGHALMALGMAAMLAPPDFLSAELLNWNIFLFTFVALWFAGRLLTRKSLLALLGARTERSLRRGDFIHVFTSICMVWMFVEMGNMTLSMTAPATYLNSACFVAFVYLLLSYARAVSKDLQSAGLDWLKLGSDFAHVLMNGVMSWMFIEMITMTMRMQGV